MYHLQGRNLSLTNLDDDYKLREELDFETGDIDDVEPYIDTIQNVSIKIYECPKKCTLKEAQENTLISILGCLEVESQDYGYSEYTIEGFNIYSLKLGGHDIGRIIEEKSKNKYLHVLIEKVK